MLTLTVKSMLEATGGELLAGAETTVINGVAVDSREVGLGAAFVALPGEHADGHDYLKDALEAGARALVVTRAGDAIGPASDAACTRGAAIIRVSDGLAAIQALASFARSRLHCPVVGVTGSTGKTTTKDMIESVLSVAMRAVSTRGNRNNELGLPLTVLEAGADTDVLVLEMGMRGTGQIEELARIARPTVGIVTNVGQTHIELLGSEEAIADAKGELVSAIPASGVVFLNGDDAHSERLAARAVAPVLRYGLGETCDIRAVDVETDAESKARFVLTGEDVRIDVSLPIPGRHNVYNALAAAAVGLHLGLSADQVVEGLGTTRGSEMRMQVFSAACGVTVVNDAYNANPTSMRAAVETLSEMETSGRRIAVLGDMAELGSLTELAHFHLGEYVADASVDLLLTVGERATRIADGARAAGMDGEQVVAVDDAEDALERLADTLVPSDVVLVKASRVMGLERVVEGIVDLGA